MNSNDSKLEQFVEDDVMFHAVKASIFAHFDANELDLVPRMERDTALQAVFDGRRLLERGFKDLLKYKKGDSKPSENKNIV